MFPENRYRLGRALQRGGTAEVFEGAAIGQGGFERRVAIKLLLSEHTADPTALDAFAYEARVLSQLHHSGIVSVLDYTAIDGRPAQVLEWIDGLDLAALLEERGGRAPLEIALFVIAEVAQALDFAHRAVDAGGRPLGLIHRDVSPENVLISWSGEVKLADFGIAWAFERSARTVAGIAKGKLAYMAPEQALGSAIDARADVYALGCLLHRMLAGRSPLEDENTRRAILSGAPPPIDPTLPEDVRTLLSSALRYRALERFGSAALVAEACSAALAKRAIADPRSLLRRWVETLRPSSGPTPPKQRRAISQLLGGDGLLEALMSPVPMQEGFEPTEPGVSTDPAQTMVDPHFLADTRVRTPVVDEPPPDPSGQTITEPMRPRPSTPRPQVFVAPRAANRTQRSGMERLLILSALLIVLVALAILSVRRSNTPEPLQTIEESPTPALGVVPAPVTPPAPVEAAKPAPPQKAEPVRPKPRVERAQVDLRALEDQVSDAINSRGLTNADVSAIENIAQARRDLIAAASKNDGAAAEAAAKMLTDQIETLVIDQVLLGRKLDRIYHALQNAQETLKKEALEALDSRYLDLRTEVRATTAPADLERLARALTQLEREINAKLR